MITRRTPLRCRNGFQQRASKPMRRSSIKRRFVITKTTDGDSEKDIKRENDQLVRDIIAWRDTKCFTCPARNGLQVGHLIRRGRESVRWDLENNHAQCPPCNSRHNEKPEIYEHEFIRRFGGERLAGLIIRGSNRAKLTYIQLSDIRDGLRSTLAALQEGA